METEQKSNRILEPHTDSLIQSGISITAAACGQGQLPVLVRAFGCEVDKHSEVVRVYVFQEQAIQLLSALEHNPSIAVVFSRPSTHETFQLKGHDASYRVLGDATPACMKTYRETFTAELKTIGYSDDFASALIPEAHANVVEIQFTPAETFNQTPGPKAGQKL